jgi:hypothetical protein
MAERESAAIILSAKREGSKENFVSGNAAEV